MEINILITEEPQSNRHSERSEESEPVASAVLSDSSPKAQSDGLYKNCAEAVFDMFEAGAEYFEISLLMTDDERIRELNRQYREKDYATDVLSFPMSEDPFEEGGMLGDIVISADTAAKQAADAGIELRRELAFLFIHGLLHLLGYDHEEGPEQEEEMFSLQEEILQNLIEKGKVP